MQNKGAIRLLAILIALVTIYQLSFTFLTNRVENAAEEYSKGSDRLKYSYLDSVRSLPAVDFPGLRGITYQDAKEKEINLGLDLKGGMNVTLEVSVVDVINSLSGYSKDSVFQAAIKRASLMQRETEDDFITLFGLAYNQIDPNARLATVFATLDLKEKVKPTSTNEEVLEVIRAEADNAIDVSFNVLRSRIDKFGVSQPNIQRLETTGRILVELPGVKEPERVRKLLQGTASLEFWETYKVGEVISYLDQANKKLAEINKSFETGVVTTDSTVSSVSTDTTKANEDLAILDELSGDSANADSALTRQQQIKENPIWAILSVPQYTDGNLINGANLGYVHKKDTARMGEYLRNDQVAALFPRDLRFAWTFKAIGDSEDFFQLVALKVTSRDGRAPLDGSVIRDASQGFGQSGGNADVNMHMTPEGAKVWARLTKENVEREIAIVLDGYVYSFPTVQNEIKNGISVITGNFTIEEAQDLANVLKSGKLPAPARIIEEAIVGPSLGQEAINSGLWSFIIAFLLVLIYMNLYYNRAGLVANIALLVNVLFIFGILASFGAVLTLPGIAGIVLTLGMAVDSNVIIFERIREELAGGKGVRLALKDGYRAAYSAIIDGNITTLLTAIILVYFGRGPIQGFATTLIIGILSSMFTSIFISRLVFERLLDKNKNVTFSNKYTEGIFSGLNIPFLQNRKMYYYISGTLIAISLIALVFRGLNYGVDFTGGRTYVIRFEQAVSTEQVANNLKVSFGQAPEVKVFGADNQVKITTKYLIDFGKLEEAFPDLQTLYNEVGTTAGYADFASFKSSIDSEDFDLDDVIELKLFMGLKSQLGNINFDQFTSDDENVKVGRMSSQKVGPTIADDIKSSAMIALSLALIAIFLYIFFRFRRWQFGLGATLALVHDSIIVLGIFALGYGILPFNLEVDQAFIAAILTVIGYSINDTVIIFDRIREWLNLHPKRDKMEIYNGALNSTIGRTINTAGTTFVVLLAIFMFGGETIRGFVFAIMIGVIIGTYSSICVASPIAFDSIKRSDDKKAVE
ncbi:MAG: protein translocase subunit SecD [Bacteroidales bacterium]|nr:protein translocase subunit SecD [Bacteroidales bacterium]